MPLCTPSPLLLLLDWDSTLTTSSTLPLIASLATHPTPHPSLPSLSAAYAFDLDLHNAAYIPATKDRTTIAQELTYLSSLDTVERASIKRIESSGIWKGVSARDIDDAAAACFGAGSVRLRAGWSRAVGAVQASHGGRVGVVSVAWSGRFIRGVLGEAGRVEGGGGVVVGDVGVVANEIRGDGSGRVEEGGVFTAGDKVRGMEGLVREGGDVGGEGGRMEPFTIYVGDSTTDLGCLLEADVGICIRDDILTGEQKALKETLTRLGVECLSIGRFSSMRGAETGRRRLWWAGDFDEVCESGILDGRSAG